MKKVERLSAPLNDHDAADGSGERVLDDCLGFRVKGVEYWVEKAFQSDYASRPWFSRVIVRWNKLAIASVIHDKPFRHGYVYNRDGSKRAVTLWEMNRVFRLIAQHSPTNEGNWFMRTWRSKDRASPLQAWLNWSGLLAGSWWSWLGRPKTGIIFGSRPLLSPLQCLPTK